MNRSTRLLLALVALSLAACDVETVSLPLEEPEADATPADTDGSATSDVPGDAPAGDATDDAGSEVDTGPPEVELAIEASAGFLTRKQAYYEHCIDHGGFYEQACRVAADETTYDDAAIDAAIAKLAAREDTADFRTAGLVRMLYLDDVTGALGEDRRSRIEQALLDFKYWIDEPGEDQMSYWTENHQILYHSAELLVGQRWRDTAFSNSGMTGEEHIAHALPRLERWLDLRGRFGFSEWHSNVYFNEDIPALLNLVDFAEDPTIRTKAAMVLDVIALDLLNNMYKGYFATTHGRTYPSKWLGGMSDSTDEFAWIALGLGEHDGGTSFGASFLATGEGWTPPPLLEDLAEAVRERHEHKQRDSFDVADGPEYGIGYEGLDDVVVWAGLQAIAHPLTINGSMMVMEEYDLWDGFLFGSLPENLLALIKSAVGTPELVDLAEQLAPLSRGLALESVDTYVYRTPDYQLAGAQDWKPGLWNAQTIMWQASLDREALVLTVAPGGIDALGGGDLAVNDPWNGGWLPRVTLHENVGVIQYDREPMEPLFEDMVSAELNHAYFPRSAFDEVVESGHWVMGRKGDSYVALWSREEAAWSDENDYDLSVPGVDNVWIVELGSAEEHGDFKAFADGIVQAEVSADGEVVYDSPSLGEVRVGWTGPMTVAGEAVDIGPYPRWDNAHQETEHGSLVTRVPFGDEVLELDFEQGRRRLLEAQ